MIDLSLDFEKNLKNFNDNLNSEETEFKNIFNKKYIKNFKNVKLFNENNLTEYLNILNNNLNIFNSIQPIKNEEKILKNQNFIIKDKNNEELINLNMAKNSRFFSVFLQSGVPPLYKVNIFMKGGTRRKHA